MVKSLADKAEILMGKAHDVMERLAIDYRRACADIVTYAEDVRDKSAEIEDLHRERDGLRQDLARAYADRDAVASRLVDAEQAIREHVEKAAVVRAFEAGEKRVTIAPDEACPSCGLMPDGSVKPMTEGAPLGICGGAETSESGCGRLVLSGQKFDMYRLSWAADFAGDKAGNRLVFVHRDCGDVADHRRERCYP